MIYVFPDPDTLIITQSDDEFHNLTSENDTMVSDNKKRVATKAAMKSIDDPRPTKAATTSSSPAKKKKSSKKRRRATSSSSSEAEESDRPRTPRDPRPFRVDTEFTSVETIHAEDLPLKPAKDPVQRSPFRGLGPSICYCDWDRWR